jgi:hypothetical protein
MAPIKILPRMSPGYLGHEGGGNCTEQNVPIYEDQWVEETIFSARKTNVVTDNPVGKFETITDDIYFGFSWFEDGKVITKECPANSFPRNADGRSLLLRITNVPGCEIFTKNSTNQPKLYLINKASSTNTEVKEGSMTKNWKGDTTDSTKVFQYQVNSNYAAEVSIRGGKIGITTKSTFGAGAM